MAPPIVASSSSVLKKESDPNAQQNVQVAVNPSGGSAKKSGQAYNSGAIFYLSTFVTIMLVSALVSTGWTQVHYYGQSSDSTKTEYTLTEYKLGWGPLKRCVAGKETKVGASGSSYRTFDSCHYWYYDNHNNFCGVDPSGGENINKCDTWRSVITTLSISCAGAILATIVSFVGVFRYKVQKFAIPALLVSVTTGPIPYALWVGQIHDSLKKTPHGPAIGYLFYEKIDHGMDGVCLVGWIGSIVALGAAIFVVWKQRQTRVYTQIA